HATDHRDRCCRRCCCHLLEEVHRAPLGLHSFRTATDSSDRTTTLCQVSQPRFPSGWGVDGIWEKAATSRCSRSSESMQRTQTAWWFSVICPDMTCFWSLVLQLSLRLDRTQEPPEGSCCRSIPHSARTPPAKAHPLRARCGTRAGANQIRRKEAVESFAAEGVLLRRRQRSSSSSSLAQRRVCSRMASRSL